MSTSVPCAGSRSVTCAGSPSVTCPSCGKTVAWTPEQASRPFCSERCRLIDLGEWASNTRRIPVDETSPQEDI